MADDVAGNGQAITDAGNAGAAASDGVEAGDVAPVADAAAKTGEQDGKADEGPAGAPAEYTDFTVPEGYTTNAEIIGEFKTLAKGLNLPQDKAQSVFDLGVKLTQSIEQQLTANFEAARQDWAKQSRADAEIGGRNFDQNLATALSAVKQFGGDSLVQVLNESGLGDHPAVIRAFHRIGKAISQDTFVPAGKPNGANGNVLSRIYDHPTSRSN